MYYMYVQLWFTPGVTQHKHGLTHFRDFASGFPKLRKSTEKWVSAVRIYVGIQQSLSNKATLFANKLWPH